jgi:hypothetical membrane protein
VREGLVSDRAQWLAGPAAAALFGLSLIGFAAARTDGYSHATKAVSELGAIGAPCAFAFNVLAFIAPGALLAWFSFRLASVADRRAGPLLLGASALMLILSGASPAKLDDYNATTTLLHIVGAMGAGLFWASALFWTGPLLSRQFGLPSWGKASPWFGLFMVANIAWQIAFQATGLVLPGWGQRIGFFGYFCWFAVTGWLLWRFHAGFRDKGRG